MGAKTSSAMIKARRLVESGKASPAEAARKTGLSATAVYQSPWYRELKGLPIRPKKEKK